MKTLVKVLKALADLPIYVYVLIGLTFLVWGLYAAAIGLAWSAFWAGAAATAWFYCALNKVSRDSNE